MANWHLEELKTALEKRGWRIAVGPGDDHRISGTWQMERAGDDRTVAIDFDGLDGEGRLRPMPEAYACHARGTTHSLYFSRRGEPHSSSRERWHDELLSFVQELNWVPSNIAVKAAPFGRWTAQKRAALYRNR